MSTYRIINRISGTDMGAYEGDTAVHALAAMYRDAGYQACVVDGGFVTDAPWDALEFEIVQVIAS